MPTWTQVGAGQVARLDSNLTRHAVLASFLTCGLGALTCGFGTFTCPAVYDTAGAIERSDGITLRAYADKWIEQRQLRPRTQPRYESMLNRLILPDLGDAKIVTVSPTKRGRVD
jgi:hypothetical protein